MKIFRTVIEILTWVFVVAQVLLWINQTPAGMVGALLHNVSKEVVPVALKMLTICLSCYGFISVMTDNMIERKVSELKESIEKLDDLKEDK